MRRRIAIAALAAALLPATGGGCGGSDPNAGRQSASGAGARISVPLSLADCTDWNNADAAERLGTIKQLAAFAGGPVVGASAGQPSGRGATLEERKAYDLLQGWCSAPFARGFKLYKLYTRAAAFTPQN
jgi:hypothetical protein